MSHFLKFAVIPDDFRLDRSNANSSETVNIINKGFIENTLKPQIDLVLSGLPIIHLNLIKYILDTNANNSNILEYLKRKGICLYGGESPTINEKLMLYQYYSKVVGLYGSTELGPKLGFSIDINLVMDIALRFPQVLNGLSSIRSCSPITFFYDKYLNNYEIISGSLVNTPLIQQAEIKIRWDQDDYCELISPIQIINAMKDNRVLIFNELLDIENRFHVHLTQIFDDLLDTDKYKNLIKYFGLILFYGRRGILYGGSNLDNKFVQSVFNKVNSETNNLLNYLALYKEPIIHDNNNNVNIALYSGLRLDLLIETTMPINSSELSRLKEFILNNMKELHCDFGKILHYYEANGQIREALDNIKLWLYQPNQSPMHKRFMKSNKRNYIIKQLQEDENINSNEILKI